MNYKDIINDIKNRNITLGIYIQIVNLQKLSIE